MEIEVGDWIRSKDGFIGKVRRITYDDMEKSNYYICEKDNIMASNYLENIAKHSKIISEVVNVGDYVNGKLIHKIDKGSNYCYLYYGNCKTFVDYQIKTILTKEQFEANCYKVGGEE